MSVADNVAVLGAPAVGAARERSIWNTIGRICRTHPRIPVFGGIVGAMFVICLIAPLLAPYPPKQPNTSERMQSPSSAHWLGTDQLGRDTFSRVLYGGRISLPLGLMAVGIGALIGMTLGILAGFFGGIIDMFAGRFVDALLAFPGLLLLIAMRNAFGAGLFAMMCVIGVLYFPAYYRLTRGQVLQVREFDYVQAANALGASPVRTMFRHVLPNSLNPLIILTSNQAGNAVLILSTLSFLGLGPGGGTPDWGAMFNDAVNNFRLQPWLVAGPGIAIFLSVLSFFMLGDDLRDLLDPRERGRHT